MIIIITTIIVIMPLDAIGYINCFFIKNSCSLFLYYCLFFLVLFLVILILLDVVHCLTFCYLSVVFGRVRALYLLRVGLSPFEGLLLYIVMSDVCIYSLILFCQYSLLFPPVRVVRRIQQLYAVWRRSNTTKCVVGSLRSKTCLRLCFLLQFW